jgi:hypothetical protein
MNVGNLIMIKLIIIYNNRAQNNGCSVAGHDDDQPSKLNTYFQENVRKV